MATKKEQELLAARNISKLLKEKELQGPIVPDFETGGVNRTGGMVSQSNQAPIVGGGALMAGQAMIPPIDPLGLEEPSRIMPKDKAASVEGETQNADAVSDPFSQVSLDRQNQSGAAFAPEKPATRSEKVSAAIKEKRKPAQFDSEPLLRILGGFLKAGTGKKIDFEPMFDERRRRILEGMMNDPASQISRQYQERAKQIDPAKDYSNVSAAVLSKTMPEAARDDDWLSKMMMQHKLRMEELGARGEQEKNKGSTWGTMRLALQDIGKRMDDVIPLKSSVARINDAFSGSINDPAKLAKLIPMTKMGPLSVMAPAEYFGSPEEKEKVGAIQQIVNMVLKTRSGAAVTHPEFARLQTEAGRKNMLTASPEVLANWLSRYAKVVDDLENNVRASAMPEAWDEYSRDMASFSSKPTQQSQVSAQGTKNQSAPPMAPAGYKFHSTANGKHFYLKEGADPKDKKSYKMLVSEGMK